MRAWAVVEDDELLDHRPVLSSDDGPVASPGQLEGLEVNGDRAYVVVDGALWTRTIEQLKEPEGA